MKNVHRGKKLLEMFLLVAFMYRNMDFTKETLQNSFWLFGDGLKNCQGSSHRLNDCCCCCRLNPTLSLEKV